jgi:hypothetical protein
MPDTTMTIPTKVFYVLLAGPVLAAAAVSIVWAGQLSELRQRVKEEDAVKARMMEVMFQNGIKPIEQPQSEARPSGFRIR